MASRHRLALLGGGALCAAALSALAIGNNPAVPTHSTGTQTTTQTGTAAQTSRMFAQLTPETHAKPSGAEAFKAASDASSPWTPLENQPSFGTPGTMLLESDGTVLVHDEPDNNTTGGTNEWWKLTPAANGSYIDGTWSQISSMPSSYSPLYFASAVLPDGRMIVEGGEYIGPNAAWSNQGAIYNPVTNSWKSVNPPKGWTNIGDAASEVLSNGTFMLQQSCNTCLTNPDPVVNEALLNSKTLTWHVIPSVGKEDPNDEEGWTLEPDGKVLTVDLWAIGGTQLFSPRTDTWSFSGSTSPTGNPVDPFPVVEIGPQAELPGGNVFVVGAGASTQETTCTTDEPTQTALYDYSTGSWSAGPEIPAVSGQEMDSTDGPASTLPDGDVLFDAGACVYQAPMHFFLYDSTAGTITQIPDVPNAPNDAPFYTRLLNLPNGQILFNDGSGDMEVYTAGGTPDSAWTPSIRYLSSRWLGSGRTYSLAGTQLAGLDQGSVYGDDVQDNTNFPLVRITNDATGAVTYARTFNWSSVSVAPGARSSTQFTLPANAPSGPSTLVVVANGIASSPTAVTVH